MVVIGDTPTKASKAARVCGVVCLNRGAMTDRGQAPWRVLPSAMQREQPISLVRSLSASIKHRVCGRLSWWSSATGPQRARLPACGVVRLSRGAMAHRGQAPRHVLPSAMQREQPISLVRSLSASIEHRVAGQARVVVVGDRPTASKAARAWRRAFEPWGNDSPWAGGLGRAAECHVA